jgi:hypothetical protein
MVDKSKVDEVKQMLEYTQKGTAKATVGNYMVVLRNDPLVRESMKYNKLTGRIYVGDNVMLHCGDPIQYTSINTSYWQSHFYAFGRPNY